MSDDTTIDELLGDVEIVPAAWRVDHEEAGQ